MAGRSEQRRREFHVKREVEQELRRIHAMLEHGNVELLHSYLQSKLGITKPLEQVRAELGSKREVIHQ